MFQCFERLKVTPSQISSNVCSTKLKFSSPSVHIYINHSCNKCYYKFQSLNNLFSYIYFDQIIYPRLLYLIMLKLTLTSLFLSLVSASTLRPRDGWKIPSTSFDSQSTFDTYWSYNYPWGSDHNGAARMESSKVTVGSGQVTLVADPVTGQPPTSSGVAINYMSGTIYAKEYFTVAANGGYNFSGQFLASTTKGTWPAFWLTGANSWPPEIDLAEWKGSGKISFNSLGMNNVWATKDVTYSNPGSWHTLSMDVRDLNGVDVQTNFYMDGSLQATQTGNAMVGKPFWLYAFLIQNFLGVGSANALLESWICRWRVRLVPQVRHHV
jgi:hypothetical protein